MNNKKFLSSQEAKIDPGFFSECRWRKIAASELNLYEDNNFFVEVDCGNNLRLQRIKVLNNFKPVKNGYYLIQLGKNKVIIDENQFLFLEPKKIPEENSHEEEFNNDYEWR